MEWQDKTEQKPFYCEVVTDQRRERMALNIGNCAVALFRKRPEMDYLAVQMDEENWIFMFDKHPLIYYMGGVALGREAQHQLHMMEKFNGFKTFYEKFGWSPDVVVEDYPSKDEVDVYMDYLMRNDLHSDLNNALKEDLGEEA